MGLLSGQKYLYFRKYRSGYAVSSSKEIAIPIVFLRIVGSVYAKYLSNYPSAFAVRNVHISVGTRKCVRVYM